MTGGLDVVESAQEIRQLGEGEGSLVGLGGELVGEADHLGRVVVAHTPFELTDVVVAEGVESGAA